MALDQSALLDLLEALKLADDVLTASDPPRRCIRR